MNEKTLELNICAEILSVVRRRSPHSFITGLTQKAERRLGVDAFIQQFGPESRVFAFQFKAPLNRQQYDNCNYRFFCGTNYRFDFQLSCKQYKALFDLADSIGPSSVYYVFPYFCCVPKLLLTSPTLLNETWFWHVEPGDARMNPRTFFDGTEKRIVKCQHDELTNPKSNYVFPLIRGQDFASIMKCGIPIQDFAIWLVGADKYFEEIQTAKEEGRHIGDTQFLVIQ